MPEEVVAEVVDDPDQTAKDAAEADAGATDEAAQPKPGTPDKVMQKLQQDLGVVTRELAALKEKKETGELSDADKAKLAKAQDRIARIRQFVGRPDREELPTDFDPVAEQVLDLSEKVSEHDTLKAQLQEATARLAVLENDRNWNVVRSKYAGLDTDAIWEKALTDANEVLADSANPRAVNRLASKWFEERCDAAKKRLTDKGKPAANNETSPATTYKVGSGQKQAPQLSDEDDALAMARMLVRET